MRFLLLFSRQGKLRLQKWFTPMSDREKKKIIRDMTSMVLSRQPRSCNFLQWKDLKIIYKRWALAHLFKLLKWFFSASYSARTATSVLIMVPTALFSMYASSVCLLRKIVPVPSFPQVRQSVFLFGCGEPGKWAVSPGGYSSLCGTARQILWQCTSSYFTLFQLLKLWWWLKSIAYIVLQSQ